MNQTDLIPTYSLDNDKFKSYCQKFKLNNQKGSDVNGVSKSKENCYNLSVVLKSINQTMDFKTTSRGWAYILEGYNLITKNQFGKLSDAISKCRTDLGYLPLFFTAEDDTRKPSFIEKSSESIDEYLHSNISYLLNCDLVYDVSFWEGLPNYVEMVVEKIDLKELNQKICKKYHVPLSTSRGWQDINQKAHIVERFIEAKDNNSTPVLLVEGDLDPHGILISDKWKEHIIRISKALHTPLSADDFIVERIGLNLKTVEQYNLSWIENIETSGGTVAYMIGNDPFNYRQGKNDKGKPHASFKTSTYQNYLKKYGARKCEANSIVAKPEVGRTICELAINKYVSKIDLSEFDKRVKEKRGKVAERFEELEITEALEEARKRLKK